MYGVYTKRAYIRIFGGLGIYRDVLPQWLRYPSDGGSNGKEDGK